MAISAKIRRATSPTPNIQKYALGLELEDAGFDRSVLSEFRDRLIEGSSEKLLLDKLLEHFKARGLIKERGKQRTDSTFVLANIRVMNRAELVGETCVPPSTSLPKSILCGAAALPRMNGLSAIAAESRSTDYPSPRRREKLTYSPWERTTLRYWMR